jgi:hypothetical protein
VGSDQVPGQDATANGTAQAGSDDLAKSGALFAPLSAAGETRRAGVMTVMDDINRRWGRGTLRTLAEGLGQPWRMRRERLSPADTTRWGELLGVG